MTKYSRLRRSLPMVRLELATPELPLYFSDEKSITVEK